MSPSSPELSSPLDDAALEQRYQEILASDEMSVWDPKTATAFVLERVELAPPPLREPMLRRFTEFLKSGPNALQLQEFMGDLCRSIEAPQRSEMLDRHFARLLDGPFAAFIADVNRETEERRIVFLANRAYLPILREAMYLKRTGHRVFLAGLAPFPPTVREVFERTFDATVCTFAHRGLLRALLTRLTPDIFHVQCMMWHYLLARLAIDHRGGAAVVCDFYDVTSVFAEREVLASRWPTDMVDLDLAMERHILHNADAVLHRFTPQVIEEWRQRHGAMPPEIEMQPYPCAEFIAYTETKHSQADGVLRFVYAGGIVPRDDDHSPDMFSFYHQIESIRLLLDQGYAVDILHDPLRPFGDLAEYADYHALARDFPRFRFLPGQSPERVTSTLAGYDFGLVLTLIDRSVLRTSGRQITDITTTKLFTYFEAGLPVVVNAEFEAMARRVVDNGLGIAIHSSEIGEIAERLQSFDYAEAVANIRRYNEDHGMHREIGRLTALYDRITDAAADRAHTADR